jgi:hypothetical protein
VQITTLEGWQATADSRLEQGAASKGLELLLSSGHTCAELSDRKRWTVNGKSVTPDAVIIASSNDTDAAERKATKGCVLVLEAKHKATPGAVMQLRRTMKFLRCAHSFVHSRAWHLARSRVWLPYHLMWL